MVPIAETGERFEDFAPYVASVDDDGVVAFQASLGGGGSGVFAGSGGPITTVAASGDGLLRDVVSHPAVTSDGSVAFYAELDDGGRGVVV
ncbi:MAG: hypothetical protein ABIZ34_10025, partial [Candidatus Limnocylindrales bacterium]